MKLIWKVIEQVTRKQKPTMWCDEFATKADAQKFVETAKKTWLNSHRITYTRRKASVWPTSNPEGAIALSK